MTTHPHPRSRPPVGGTLDKVDMKFGGTVTSVHVNRPGSRPRPTWTVQGADVLVGDDARRQAVLSLDSIGGHTR